MRMNAWMLCLATCLAVATTVEAQPGGGRRGGGGFGGGNSIFGVATNEAVQKELGLSTDEAAKVKEVSDEFNTAFGAAMGGGGGGGGFRDMSAEDRAKFRDKMADAGKTTTEKFLPKLKAVLTADQFTRVQQINWQSSMARAMADPEIVKSLTISKEQQDKIKTISDEATAKMFTPGGGGSSREEVTKERDEKIDGVLTKDQTAKFATLKGKEFDVAQLRGGGRGGPGGGNNAGGGGGGARPKRPQPKAE